MANNVGVTASTITGNTLTVTFGITGATPLEDVSIYFSFDPSGISDVVVTNLAGFSFSDAAENAPGEWTIIGAGITEFSPGTNLYSVAFEFSSPPASLAVNVSGSFGATTLTEVDVALFDGGFNTLPFGDVSITGTPTQGATLTASNTLDDFDGNGTVTYQWQANDVDIDGATESTLVLSQSEVGKVITVVALYTDGEGNSEAIESAPTAVVDGTNDAPVGVADVVVAVEDTQATFLGATLLANDTDVDGDPLAISSVNSISGGTAVLNGGNVVFTPAANFNGAASFSYIATDGNGGFTAATTVTVNVTPQNDPATGAVTIAGTAKQGETLTASNSLADVDGLGPISYRWQAGGVDIAGATSSTLLLTQSEVGKTISVIASFTDGDGTVETKTSPATAAVSPFNQSPSGTVLIQGEQIVGAFLEAVPNFTDPDGISTALSYQWYRDGVQVPGAVNSTYLLAAVDLDSLVRVRVSYTDDQGTAEVVFSSSLLIDPENSPPVGVPLVDGNAVNGEILTADTSAIEDADGLGEFIYQWFRDFIEIDGATGESYLLGPEDVGSAITVEVTYTDGRGSIEQLSSQPTAQIEESGSPNNPPSGLAMLFGAAEPGGILEINAGAVSDPDGLGPFSYQWFVDDQSVAGATSSTFQLRESDIGKLVNVSLAYTDGAGFQELVDGEARFVNDPTSASFADLIKVYVVILGRAPANSGLEFWSSKINEGRTFEDVATAMWNSPGARSVYPDNLSDEQKVSAFYENILNRLPNESGLQFWLERWETVGPVETMLRMINALSANNSTDPQAIADKVLFQAKVDIGGYLANELASEDIDLAADAYLYLEAGNSIGETIDYINEQVAMIGQAPIIDDGLG